ncbi:MAG: glycerol-3-phosphate responsive antiterminator [Oscillospiraceae bacterium]|nr:glycerol-3-phosphate responsive antiterminator [Oscillospiraceae bacterium]
MVESTLSAILKENPIICAVKSYDDLTKSLACESKVVFVLFGDVLSIGDIVAKVKAADKYALVHIDLIEGLASRDVAVDYLAGSTQVDGIISTKASIIRRAKALGLFAIQRFFVLDSMALVNIQKQIPFEGADAIEVLPGAMPKIIKTLTSYTRKPIIASGLINDKEDVIGALGAGALSVSSSNSGVWFL